MKPLERRCDVVCAVFAPAGERLCNHRCRDTNGVYVERFSSLWTTSFKLWRRSTAIERAPVQTRFGGLHRFNSAGAKNAPTPCSEPGSGSLTRLCMRHNPRDCNPLGGLAESSARHLRLSGQDEIFDRQFVGTPGGSRENPTSGAESGGAAGGFACADTRVVAQHF